jgi:FtsZ-binding cell division protein ZapB
MKKFIYLWLLYFIPMFGFSQNVKIKSDDIVELKNEVSNLKFENQKLTNEVYQLKESFNVLERLIRNYSPESNQRNFDKLNTAILFLGQDINSLFKGYIKNMPEKYSNSNSTNNISDKKAPVNEYSGQCNATTKKGSRCSRSAKSNGFCWQHGG